MSVLEKMSRGDWRSVESLYRQFMLIVRDQQPIPPDVTGTLAQSLGRTLAYYERREDEFGRDLFALWSKIEGPDLRGSDDAKFLGLYRDKRLDNYVEYSPADAKQRRRPRPFESSVETCRRLTALNGLRDTMHSLPSGAILGGSLSYGRFYNVAGNINNNASDIDLLLVIPSYSLLESVATALSKTIGVDAESLSSFRDRIKVFLQLQRDKSPCIFSHKLRLWRGIADPVLEPASVSSEYNISLHVFSLQDFEYVTLSDMEIIEKSNFERVLIDYRDTQPDHSYAQRSFSGIPLGEHPPNPQEVQGGYLALVQVCLIGQNRYCPGLHQNLILPQFERRWDSPELHLELKLYKFRWKILERLRAERTMRPFEEQRLSFSHVRFNVFAPHITRRANRAEL